MHKLIKTCIAVILVVITCNAYAQTYTIDAHNIPPTFSATYHLKKAGLKIAEVHVSLEKKENGEWQYLSETLPAGVASLFFSKTRITEKTILVENDLGIYPVRFDHIHKGSDKDRDIQIRFDRKRLRAETRYKGEEKILSIDPECFDNFSSQLVIMANLDKLPETFTIPVISKNKLKDYTFQQIGKERIKTKAGEYDTLIIERRKDNRKKTSYRVWLGEDFYGIPVRFEKFNDGDSEYAASLAELTIAGQDHAPANVISSTSIEPQRMLPLTSVSFPIPTIRE